MKPVQLVIYHPKGSMCCVCRDLKHDCSHLPFDTMPVITHGEGFKIVKCTAFQRVAVPDGVICPPCNGNCNQGRNCQARN